VSVIEKGKGRLLPLGEVYERLSATEPMTAVPIHEGSDVRFTLEPDWAMDLDATEPDELVGAHVSIDAFDLQLTKEAALQAGAAFGLPAAYVKKTPAKFIEPQLNYWYNSGIGSQAYNLMAQPKKNAAYAFAKPTVEPFSNLALLERVERAVRSLYSGEILVDFKFDHSLTETNIRLVFPELNYEIVGTDMDDLTGPDLWSPGIAVKNSLIGKKQTHIEGYLFRWASLAGAIFPVGAGAWSRKSQGQSEDLVLEWARETVLQDVWTSYPVVFPLVQALTRQGIGHNLGEILREVFEMHKVPVTQRNIIIEDLLPVADPTMYHLQAAISRTANDRNVTPARVDTLLRISGAVTAGVFDPEKAKVWREGNKAPKGATSPYEIQETV
jgi:hypothetical protein